LQHYVFNYCRNTTGWGYGLPIFQRIKRERVRKIKSHIKGVVVLGLNEKGERIVLGASLDKAYSPRETYFSNG
jgi:hypothetical protein